MQDSLLRLRHEGQCCFAFVTSLSVSLLQPGSDLRPQLFVRATAYHHADVSDRKDQVVFIAAADQIDQGETGLRVYYVIVFADDVEHWASDIAKIDRPATNLQAALSRQIVLEEPFR